MPAHLNGGTTGMETGLIHRTRLLRLPIPAHGRYEQCGAAVDLIGHRLLPVRYRDAKATP